MYTDIKPILVRKFGAVKESKGKHGREYIITCPFCNRKNKMYINAAKGLYICYRCGKSGKASSLVGNVSFDDNKEIQRPKPLPDNVASPGCLLGLTQLSDDSAAIMYLSDRGFDIQELNDVFGVRYCTEGREFAGGIFSTTNTIIFPIWMDGRLIGWQSRLLYNPEDIPDSQCEAMGYIQDEDGDWVRPPKYWTSPGITKGRILYNYDWARKSDIVIVCEGTFDAISTGKCAVAAFGKGISPNQAKMLKQYWDVVVILLDPGDAGKDATKITASLRTSVCAINMTLEGYEDPGSTPRLEIWSQIYDALTGAGIKIEDYRLEI